MTERLYGDVEFVEERHRHRYEVNPKLVDELEAAGLSFVGRDETGERMEITELKGTCWHAHTLWELCILLATCCGKFVLRMLSVHGYGAVWPALLARYCMGLMCYDGV